MGFNSGFKGLKTQYLPRSKHISFIKTNQFMLYGAESRCLF